MTEEKRKSLHRISELLCEAYNSLLRKGEVSFPLHDSHIDKIDSIVKTIHSSYFGVQRFKTAEEKAAAYFCLIIKGHPVTDGNKRLALLWFQIFCESFGIAAQVSPFIALDILAVAVEQAKLDHYSLIELTKRILFDYK